MNETKTDLAATPTTQPYPSPGPVVKDLTEALQAYHDDGWRGVVNHAPDLAKDLADFFARYPQIAYRQPDTGAPSPSAFTTPPVKPGVKTSEFWMIVPAVAGALAMAFKLPDDAAQLIALGFAVALAAGYAVLRHLVKHG